MAKQTFTTGQVLTAAQMTQLQQTAMLGGAANAQAASYVLVAGDAGNCVSMSNAGATTITVNTGIFAAGDIVTIINIGAGTCTITAGTATVSKPTNASLALVSNAGGVLYFTATGAAIFMPFDVGSAGTSPLTTKGDLFTFDTANARLPVGTNNFTLVADSSASTGLKWQGFSGASCYKSAAQTIANATFTAVTFNNEYYDTDSIHNNSTNTSRFTANKAGKWLFVCGANWAVNANGLRLIAIYKNGTGVYYPSQIPVGNGTNSILHQGTYVIDLAVNDYVEMFVYQSSGGNLDLSGGANQTEASISYLGA